MNKLLAILIMVVTTPLWVPVGLMYSIGWAWDEVVTKSFTILDIIGWSITWAHLSLRGLESRSLPVYLKETRI